MTKETVLAKRIIQFPGDEQMTDEAIKRNVYAAMDEYAKAQSIAFKKWSSDWNYINDETLEDKDGYKTTPDNLYTLFLSHQSLTSKEIKP
jgi:hypothetical protein